jgi:tetratricopeptide (TPR) repeat protein
MLRTTVPFALAVSLVASVAAAQNALDPGRSSGRQGDRTSANPASRQGNALDANLLRGSGGANSAQPQENFAARNLIVTGNVAGGRGFRGSVGYTAPTDFRGVTGSDATFRFRADSVLTSPVFLSGTRMGDRFQLAQQFGVLSYRRDTTPDDPAASSGQVPGLFRLDRATAQMSAARMLEASAEPIGFAIGLDRNRRQVEFTASPAQGLRMRPLDDPLAGAPMSSFERARAREDIALGRLDPRHPIRAFESPLSEADRTRNASMLRPSLADSLRIEGIVVGDRIGSDPASPSRSAYDDIVRRVVSQFGEDPSIRIDADPKSLERARRELGTVREALTGRRPAQRSDSTSAPLPDPTQTSPAAEPAQPTEAQQLSEMMLEAARGLRHGTQVRDLTPGERARVDELVRDAQLELERSDFFRAERFFDSALTLNPNNPLLLAGLANSQLGAGVYLSAARTLRTLFTEYPEMIDTRYEARLLPNETRLRLCVEALRERMRDSGDAPSYALVLAYVGHQLSNRALVEEALGVMSGSDDWDAMRELLRGIWLSE